MTDKKHEDKVAEIEADDKRAADRREAEARAASDRREAGKTPSPAPRTGVESYSIPPEEMLTEQEKDAKAGGAATDGNVPGVGPAPASEVTSGPVETVEDQGIGPRTPYPTGNPPPPDEGVTYSQGIKGASDKRHAKPGSSSGPAGQAPRVDDRDKTYEANRKQDEPHIKPRSNP